MTRDELLEHNRAGKERLQREIVEREAFIAEHGMPPQWEPPQDRHRHVEQSMIIRDFGTQLPTQHDFSFEWNAWWRASFNNAIRGKEFTETMAVVISQLRRQWRDELRTENFKLRVEIDALRTELDELRKQGSL